jgi:hypothetical protein
MHGKRRVAEADALPGADEVAERVYAALGCPHYERLSLPQQGT